MPSSADHQLERALQADADDALGADAERRAAGAPAGWRARPARGRSGVSPSNTSAVASGVRAAWAVEQRRQRASPAPAPRWRSSPPGAAAARSSDSSGKARDRRAGSAASPLPAACGSGPPAARPSPRSNRSASYSSTRRQLPSAARPAPASGRTWRSPLCSSATARPCRPGRPRVGRARRVLQLRTSPGTAGWWPRSALGLQLLDQPLERQVLVRVGAPAPPRAPAPAARGSAARPPARRAAPAC